ncbi:MAG: hypothetical protein LQ350_002071 [Teloschistes chrysophthalmus]|nr:MAG: hypothetical protein LQ350_002071 [Niorma chrysophthalma]
MHSLLSTIGHAVKTTVLNAVAVAGITYIGIYGLAAGVAASRFWHQKSQKAKTAAIPGRSCLSSRRPLDAPMKQKKRVRLDMWANTTHTYTPVVAKFVAFHWHRENWIFIDHESDPAGYDTLHCRKTLWVRGTPEIDELVDDDGDIEMGGL